MFTTDNKITLTKLKDKINKISKNNKILKVGFLTAEMSKIAVANEYGGIYPVSESYRNRALSEGVNLGSTISIIPRPFMLTTVKNHKKQWNQILLNKLKNNDSIKALSILGEIIKTDIQNTISNNNFIENPPHIVKIKGRNQPLIDSGKMRNSVDYEIK